ncbi:MAG: hemolytic protein HlpA-like protein [Anabaena sp. WA113]|jgi:hypothetical protein|nr:MAG: hemolytic protein HlpA-like protein [Anabaena sp. WA113]
MSCETPIAFFIFRRPDLTTQVFEAIRQAKPKKLLVVADGPRNESEAILCQQARAVIETVDWDCEILRNYVDENLGCRKRVSSGLDWVFAQVEEAIVLEDDCLPSPSFFHFCETLLERYRDDERIMHISGNNLQFGQHRTNYSYYFSKYNHIWGWASWKRAWKHYDLEMKTWEEFKISKITNSIHSHSYEQNYWLNIFETVHKGLIDTWDYQWTYACWSQGGLSILPNVNLVSNIGFRDDATHTKGESELANLSTEDIYEICHPSFLVRDYTADEYTFNHVFGGKAMREANTFSGKLRSHLSTTKQRIIRLFTDPVGLFSSFCHKIVKTHAN